MFLYDPCSRFAFHDSLDLSLGFVACVQISNRAKREGEAREREHDGPVISLVVQRRERRRLGVRRRARRNVKASVYMNWKCS